MDRKSPEEGKKTEITKVESASSLASDSDSEDEYEKDEAAMKDMLLGEYIKVTRTKVKYKCDFRNVIMCIRGKDYVVRTLTADFDY